MRAALVAVAVPLYAMSEFDDGLLRVDSVLGPTAASTFVDPRNLTVWLRRVTKSWEGECVEFRQAGAGVPQLARCVAEHDQYLNWKSTTATVREELRSEMLASGSKPQGEGGATGPHLGPQRAEAISRGAAGVQAASSRGIHQTRRVGRRVKMTVGRGRSERDSHQRGRTSRASRRNSLERLRRRCVRSVQTRALSS